eukprot:TRINITY_DN12112_c0_g1_i4.p1 TRINITY_DN12112_c0_g1~~TRINITY_DN12112_c0_g1_i4.p1  ORF type:complete len:125 (-),score=25.94 TRINITY_DN12112_c0_g1_i4:32-406(-)
MIWGVIIQRKFSSKKIVEQQQAVTVVTKAATENVMVRENVIAEKAIVVEMALVVESENHCIHKEKLFDLFRCVKLSSMLNLFFTFLNLGQCTISDFLALSKSAISKPANCFQDNSNQLSTCSEL